MHQDYQCTFCQAVGHQIAAPPRDKNYKRTGTIAAYVLFVLTVYPKKGGNIQVATKVLELLAPVKMHFLSLARALSAMEDGKEACSISEKRQNGMYHTENKHTLLTSPTLYLPKALA